MSTPIQLQDLVADVAHAHPSAQLEFDPLPSGVCFFWVSLDGRNFVIEYDPKSGAGVSENFPDTPPFIGHDEAFPLLDEAVARFKELLASAARGETASSPFAAMALHDRKT